jgi:uncharacterized repeat protein (TIGR04076 family)
MERRSFVRSAFVASAGATAALNGSALLAQERQEATTVKATVLRVTLDEELDKQYRGGGAGPCPVFHVGQEFLIRSPYLCPEGFCAWAWADIRAFIQTTYFGDDGPSIACCTDGIRPVFFKLEKG